MTALREELRSLLEQVCNHSELSLQASAILVKDSLSSMKEVFVKLLDDLPKEPQLRTSLQSGKVHIDNKEYRVNEDFVKQAISLSDQLDISEKEACRLLLGGISTAPLMSSTPLNAAVFLYHDERGYILTILNEMLKYIENQPVDDFARIMLIQFMKEVMEASTNPSFIQKILASEKKIAKLINTIANDNTTNSTTVSNGLQIPAQPSQPSSFFQPMQQQQQLQQQQLQQQQALADALKFDQETNALRIERLMDERACLVQILYHIASLFWLPEVDLLAVLDHVETKNLSDASYPYLMVAVLAALSNRNKENPNNQISNDQAFVKKIHEHITTKQWKVSTSKALVQIQWGLFLSEAVKAKASIETAINMNSTERIKFVESAISLDAFGFMNKYLLYFKQDLLDNNHGNTIKAADIEDADMEIDGLIVDPSDYSKFVTKVWEDFQKFIVHELELFTTSFIFNMSDVFSNIKKLTAEEIECGLDDDSVENTSSLSQFLTLLASVYRNRPNAGLKFWIPSNGLNQFLAWLLDLKSSDTFAATFDFLSSIAAGEQCSLYAHNTLKIGTYSANLKASHIFSWGKLFSTLKFYSEEYAKYINSEAPPSIPLKEEEVIHKFLRLCQEVVQYCNSARIYVWSEPTLHAPELIINMIKCPTSTRIRAALYHLLAGFCSSWGGGINHVGRKISLTIWQVLESSDMVIANKTLEPKIEKTAVIPSNSASVQVNALFVDNHATGLSEQLQLQSIIDESKSTKLPRPTPSYCLPEQPAGFLCEFENEKSRRMYIETQSILDLFVSLIHTQSKRDKLVSGFSPAASSIPFCLGSHSNRMPGTAPYMSLVIDRIFLKLDSLEYIHPESKWQLADACLHIIENSIASLDLKPLCDYLSSTKTATDLSTADPINILQNANAPAGSAHEGDKKAMENALLAYITHPGYDILSRILSGSSLVHELFRLIERGRETIVEISKTERNTYLRSSMIRCLRIFEHVFDKQDAFVNVFLPQVMAHSSAMPMGKIKLGQYTFPAPSSTLQSLAKLMLYHNEVIVQIALMVNCEDDLEICQKSINILNALATVPDSKHKSTPHTSNHIHVHMGGIGPKLASILSTSSASSAIVLGFSQRIEIENANKISYDDYEYDINVIPFWLAKETLGNICNYEESLSTFSSSVYASILDLLLENTKAEIASPTFTEFLLGFDVEELEAKGIQHKSISSRDPSRLSCLEAVTHVVQAAAQYDAGSTKHSRPVLTEKLYQLLYKLSSRKSTATPTLHYLRNLDSFYTQQFKMIASRFERALSVFEPDFEGILICDNGAHVRTDYFTIVSTLNQRAWLLKMIALELYSAVCTSSKSAIFSLLKLLYGVGVDDDVENMERMNLDQNNECQQPLSEMLEIVHSLEFQWVDNLDKQEPRSELKYFKDLDVNTFLIKKPEGYEVYDIYTVYKRLRQYQLVNTSAQTYTEEDRIPMELELGNILQLLVAENRHREIKYGRLHCLRAWKQVVEVTLSDCFDMFTFADRERIIYDLLTMLLPKLANNPHKDVLKEISEVILSLLTRLRKDKRRQSVLQSHVEQDLLVLPIEKLQNVFTSIVIAICAKTSTIDIRNTMYSALVNLLQHMDPKSNQQAGVGLLESIGAGLKKEMLDIISNDAHLGLDAYKANAFSALESLYVLVGKDGTSILHDYLADSNFLRLVIDLNKQPRESLTNGTKDSSALSSAQAAKMSLFLRISTTKQGTSLLLHNNIILSLINSTNSGSQTNSLNPKDLVITEHQRKGLGPVLELINSILKSLIEYQGTEIDHIRLWVTQNSMILSILKDTEQQVTLSSLHLLRMTTLLIYQLSTQPGYFSNLNNKELKALDEAMINLIPKYCVSENMLSKVAPSNAEEEKLAKDKTPGHHEQKSLFIIEAEKHISSIKNSLLAYAVALTFNRIQKGSFKPVFSNILESMKGPAPKTIYKTVNTTPSLTHLVACLQETGKKLSKAVADYTVLCAQKENVTSLKYEEAVEIAQNAIPKELGIGYDGLSRSQQFRILLKEINHRYTSKHQQIQDYFLTLENATFILWRHLEFYLKIESMSISTDYNPCERYANEEVVLFRQAAFQTSPTLIQHLKKACCDVLEPVLQKLESIPSSTDHSKALPHLHKRMQKLYH